MPTLPGAKPLRFTLLFVLLIVSARAGFAQWVAGRYALVLEDAPVAARYAPAASLRAGEPLAYRSRIEERQRALRAQLASRGIQVTGTAATLVNAVFVRMPESRVAEARSLDGVAGVVPLRRYKKLMNRAAELVSASAAWARLGGQANGGAGVKIAVLDTGIDHTHPSLQDPSLPVPPGYPKCEGADCSFTNNKIIAARSYTKYLAAGTDAANPAADSRPDDLSPRDREGHGTAIASAAAGVNTTGVVTFSGIAPKAYLGNYKIYGSPGVNEYTNDEVIIRALEDAVNDGMDIISFSTGSVAFTGPLDSGSACGNQPGVPCDLSAVAFDNAAKAGAIIVVAAGNEGDYGWQAYPTYHTISSPANVPSVITVGASSNSHYFRPAVSVEAAGAPSTLKGITALPSNDASGPYGAVTAPLVDVTTLGDDGLACAALPAGSLTGKFALIQRGVCTFEFKTYFALDAGAVGVVFYMADANPLVSPSGLGSYYGSFAMISLADGTALKSYLASNPGALVTIDPTGREVDWDYANELAYFSSLGPTTGDAAIKPDLVAPGEDIYMATQRFDPLGFMYSATRYLAASGTSFSTPIVAGAAALVKQAHPGFDAAQVRSALVNTASQDVTVEEYYGQAVDVRGVGAGKLNADAAASAPVTVSPVSLSFGEITSGSLPLSRQLRFTNTSSSAVNLTLALSPAGTVINLDKASLSLAPGASDTVTATLSGALPAPGAYSGAVTAEGSGASLRIPYLYLVASGTPANLIGLSGGSDGTVGQPIPERYLAFRAVDAYGLPVRGLPVVWSSMSEAQFIRKDVATDNYGVAYAQPVLGQTPGTYRFSAMAGNGQNMLNINFSVYARPAPVLNAVVNAASFEAGAPVAPGSYVAFFGSGLSDGTHINKETTLPMSMDYTLATFDVPSAGISVPGRLTFVSPEQVNVQVPWELQGQASARVKVIIRDSYGNVINVPLADYAPAFFETSAGIAAALDANNNVVTTGNAVERGKVVQLFLNGLGPVTNPPATGEPALASPLSETTTTPVVTIGGVNCPVLWSGLTPTLPGLYQINVTVPQDLGTGTLPVTVTIGGVTSKASGLPVK